ncbi:MAG: hypothetical protein IH959_04615 [Chloroflexi bacterium]|nr:hypothetical protein [Chloroflexota bacterium]
MLKLATLSALLALATAALVAVQFGRPLSATTQIETTSCAASFEVNFNDGGHPALYLEINALDVRVVQELDQTKRMDILGDSPFINVTGVFTPTGFGEGDIFAEGDGNYAGFDTMVTFTAHLFTVEQEFLPGRRVDRLTGKFSVGPDGTLPGGQSIDYALTCEFEPEPTPTSTQPPPGAPTPTVTPTQGPKGKISLTTSTIDGDGVEDFQMNLYSGTGCVPANLITFGATDAEGVFSIPDQPEGTYSASRKGRPGWNDGDGSCFDDFSHFAPGTNINFIVESDRNGDVNGDGSTNSVDAAIVLQFDAGFIDSLPNGNANGDVNGDGVANSIDAALILQFNAGLLDSLPR